MECAEAARIAVGGGRYKAARSAMREQEPQQNRYRVAPARQTGTPMSARGPTDERQEHMDAIVSFAGAGRAEALVSGARHSHDQVGDGKLAGRVSLPAQHAADVFLKKRKTRLRNSSMTRRGFAR